MNKDILSEIQDINETMKERFDLLEKICDIMEALKLLALESNIEKDISYIKSTLAAVEHSPRALSRSEAAVQNTQVLIKKIDELLKAQSDNDMNKRIKEIESTEDTILEKIDLLNERFELFINIFGSVKLQHEK